MPTGRPLVPLSITPEQPKQLLALRSRILLLAADGVSNTEIACRQGCSLPTAGKWRQRFLNQGLDGLLDEPRPGTPRRISFGDGEGGVTRTL